MKDNLIELLFNLFEKSLNQLQKNLESNKTAEKEPPQIEQANTDVQFLYLNAGTDDGVRVLNYQERIKLTKASCQFLMRMKFWGVIHRDLFELVLNQLLFSDSGMVSLEESKWALRNLMAPRLNQEQMVFLDMILYQTKDKAVLH